MEFKTKVKKLDDGSYMAFAEKHDSNSNLVGTPGAIVYADSAGESYEIMKSRLKAKGHTVVEDAAEIIESFRTENTLLKECLKNIYHLSKEKRYKSASLRMIQLEIEHALNLTNQ